MKGKALIALALLLPCAVAAQTAADIRVSAMLSSADGTSVQGTFACVGTPTCTGEYSLALREIGCSNTFHLHDTVVMTGLELSQPGPIQGTLRAVNGNFGSQPNSDGTCSISQSRTDALFNYTGHWDGANGTFSFQAPDHVVSGTIKADVSPPTPVFPMAVTSRIDASTATVSAQIQFRPQDVGRQGRVFVFALAPQSRVIGGQGSGVMKVVHARDGKKADTPVPCVLAQLNASGQMAAVSSANLDAFLSGVLSAQGASVSILDNVPTPNVAGATFFVGYGPDGDTMLNSGVNRAAVTVPGTLECRPGAPQTGWWWNPLEDGRGYSVEVRGSNIFFASFLYDVSGRSTWYVSSGPVSLEGSYYSGALLNATGGQTLGGSYPGRPAISTLGDMTLTFHNDSSGTLVWPGGTVPIQRFNIVSNGLNLPAVAGQPESGWWWNPDEDGRGFFMEWQNGTLDIAGYMYDDAGNPVWYLTVGAIGGTSAARSFSGSWWSYGNGMTLHGPWRQHQQTSSNVAPLTITFTGSDTALMTLPNGRTTQLTRHRF